MKVRLWANPGAVIDGKVREIAPVADPATRTYPVKIEIADDGAVRLGMSALVQFTAKTENPMVRVPLTALHHEKNVTSVWIVEKGAVRLAPVQIGGAAGNDVLLAAGVAPGQTLVTAGVNLLKPGQKVKILGDEAVAPQQRKQIAAADGVAK